MTADAFSTSLGIGGVAVAVVALVVSIVALNHSRRSADAAEASAKASERAADAGEVSAETDRQRLETEQGAQRDAEAERIFASQAARIRLLTRRTLTMSTAEEDIYDYVLIAVNDGPHDAKNLVLGNATCNGETVPAMPALIDYGPHTNGSRHLIATREAAMPMRSCGDLNCWDIAYVDATWTDGNGEHRHTLRVTRDGW